MKKSIIPLFIAFILHLMSFPLHSIAADTTRMSLPEGTIARLGKGIINEIAYSPDGMYLAVAASIGIWIYDMETYQEVVLLTGPAGHTKSVDFSPNGKTIISGSQNGVVYLWDTDTWTHNKTLTGNLDWVECVTLTPDGNIIAIGGEATEGSAPSINLWNANIGELLKEFGGPSAPSSLCFSPDGKTLVGGDRYKNGIPIWNVNTGEPIKTLTGHEEFESINSIVFSPGGNIIASASDDKTVRLWKPNTGILYQTLTTHTKSVNSVVFSADGRTLISAGDDGIRVWNSNTAESNDFIAIPAVSVVFSPDGKTFVSGSSDGIRVWDARTRELLKTIDGYSDSVSSVVYSPDGNTIVSGNLNNIIHMWDANTGELIKTLIGHTDSVASVAISPDGNTIASGSSDKTIRLWDSHTATHRKTLTGHTGSVHSVTFNPDGKILASGGWKQTRLWDVHSGEHRRTLTSNSRHINSVVFSSDGNIIASGGDAYSDEVVHLWDVHTGEHKKTLTKYIHSVNSVVYTPDGNTIIAGGWSAGEEASMFEKIYLWDASTGNHIKTLTDHIAFRDRMFAGVASMVLSPDGNILVYGEVHSLGYGGDIHLWDFHTREYIGKLIGHTSSVDNLAFSPDGKTLASGGRDGTILLWDFSNIP